MSENIPSLAKADTNNTDPVEEDETDKIDFKKVDKQLSQCTYDQGYINQNVYACRTCYKEKEKDQLDSEINEYCEKVEPVGFCLSCSYICHDGHEVYELYRKNNFRCDCGNIKINHACSLNDNKESENLKNKYNHNFFGKFGYCNKEYEGVNDGQMVQCVLCEDWYHHQGFKLNWEDFFDGEDDPEDFDVIGANCTQTYSFLGYYSKFMYLIDMVKEGVKNKANISQAIKSPISKISKNDASIGCKRSINQMEHDSEKQSENLDVSHKKSPINKNCTHSESGPNEEDKVVELPKVTKGIKLKNDYLDIADLDVIFKSELIEHLGQCDMGKETSDLIRTQIVNSKNIPEDQLDLEKGLNGEHSLEYLDEEPDAEDSNNQTNPNDYNDFFTKTVIQEYPHVTPDKRFEIYQSFQEKLKGLFQFAAEKVKDSDDKTITPEHVKEFLQMNNLDKYLRKD